MNRCPWASSAARASSARTSSSLAGSRRPTRAAKSRRPMPRIECTSRRSASFGSLPIRRTRRVRSAAARASEKVASSTRRSGCVRARCTARWRATMVFPVPADPATRAGRCTAARRAAAGPDAGRPSTSPRDTPARGPALRRRPSPGSGAGHPDARRDPRPPGPASGAVEPRRSRSAAAPRPPRPAGDPRRRAACLPSRPARRRATRRERRSPAGSRPTRPRRSAPAKPKPKPMPEPGSRSAGRSAGASPST